MIGLQDFGKPDTRPDDPAIQELDRKLQLNPDDATAYYRRGQLFAQFGDFQRAIEDFDQTLRLSPNDAEALNNRCWARASHRRIAVGAAGLRPGSANPPPLRRCPGQPRVCQPQTRPAEQGDCRLRPRNTDQSRNTHPPCTGAGSPSCGSAIRPPETMTLRQQKPFNPRSPTSSPATAYAENQRR